MSATSSRRRTLRAAWLWTALATAIRIAWLVHEPAAPAWDGAIYARTAQRIARGMGFVDTWNNRPPYRPTAFYPVGYPAILGAGYAIAGVRAWVPGVLNVLASAVSVFIAVLLARRAYGALAGHVTGFLSAGSLGAILYTSAYMTELVSAAILMLAVLAAVRHARDGRAGSAIAAGMLLGVGALIRPPALLVAPALAFAMVPAWNVRAVARTAAMVGFATALVVLPWTVRNCRQLDACTVVSVNGGSNLFIGTDPEAHGGYRDLRAGEGCDRVYGEVAKDRCYMRLALARIAAHPIDWLALVPEKLEQLLADEVSPISYLRTATHGARYGAGAARLYPLITSWHRLILALALVALVPIARRRPTREAARIVAIVVTAVAVLLAVHAVFFGVDRYHFVFMPLVCVLAGGAFRPVVGDAEP